MTVAAAPTSQPVTTTRRPLPSWLTGIVAVLVLVVIWEGIIEVVAPHSKVWPPPTRIVSSMVDDGWHFYWPNLRTTLWEASRGFLYGNLIAIALALLAVTVPPLEGPLTQLGVVSYCLPIVAIGTIFVIVFTGETAKVILAAMSVFFTTFVGMVLGLRSAPASSLDLVRAYGGGRLQQIWRVRLRSSLPSLFAALRIAAPAAVLGAMIGEYLGEQDSGLGYAMVASEQGFNVPRTWGIALTATLIGGVAFVLIGVIGRRLTPWAEGSVR
jgi:ABC-type nitrate/sulfonate/bicarbonate transport system permease component